MTGNELILDTNVVIELFKKNAQVMAVVAKASDVYIPVVVLGELHVGSFRSVNRLAKNTEIENFTATCIVLEMHEILARTYAATKAALLKKGRLIPENDIWIAATAIQYDLPIFTFDRHFKEVDGLQLFNPLTSI